MNMNALGPALVRMPQVLLGVIIVALACLTVSCGDLCGDEVRSQVPSPDKAWTASWWVRDCGATTDFSTHVSVHGTGDDATTDTAIVFIMKGKPELSLKWIGPAQLSIHCPDCLHRDVFRQVDKMGHVKIAFDFNPGSGGT